MKTKLFTHCSAALAMGVAIAFASCNKIESELPVDDGTITIEFQQVDPDSVAEGATRTEFHEKTIWWSKGDKVRLFQYASVNGTMKCVTTSTTLSSAKELLSVSVGSFNTPDEGTDSYYFAIFPYASYSSYNLLDGHAVAKINTPDTQTPTATSFDPAADLLISNYPENLTKNSEGKYIVKLSYYRQVALGKMHLKNLPSESEIASVEFSAEHDGAAVTLAGSKWYDFTTQAPYSVTSRKYNLILDYSTQEIAGDMTAYFCCYPFELDADDTFTVKVVTKAGEVFTRKVTLPASRTLSFEPDRGTQFTVDMSTATKTVNWFTVNEYSSSSSTKTTNKIYYTFKTSAKNVVSGKFMAVSEEVFAGITDIGAYLDEKGTSISDASIESINSSGTSYITNTSKLTGDSWYVVMCKLVLDDETVGVAITRIKTDWFTLTAETRAEGGISFRLYGANISSATRNSRIIATDGLPEGTTFEKYYTSTLAPGGIPTATLESINQKAGVTGAGYYSTKYYTGKSTQVDMVPGANYTVMIKVVNERGETRFVTANANAGGSAE
ncbi:MAG: hypothetical protein IJK29_01970 [Bacteroidales bacterium]|nr:hypothetical protein [Bacteroidales bacterium]